MGTLLTRATHELKELIDKSHLLGPPQPYDRQGNWEVPRKVKLQEKLYPSKKLCSFQFDASDARQHERVEVGVIEPGVTAIPEVTGSAVCASAGRVSMPAAILCMEACHRMIGSRQFCVQGKPATKFVLCADIL